MAGIRRPTVMLRSLLPQRVVSGLPHCPSQRRWAQVHDVRYLATHNTREAVLAKYKEKLDRKAKEEGLSNIDELKQAYQDRITELRKKSTVPGANAPFDAAAAATASIPQQAPSPTSPFPPPPPPPAQPDLGHQPVPPSSAGPTSSSPPPPPPSSSVPKPPPAGIKTLSSFVDVAKMRDLPPREIEYLWRLRHAGAATSLCGVVPAATYAALERAARRHPQFVLPLPARRAGADAGRGEGREGGGGAAAASIHFLQWAFPAPDTATVVFTHLAEYKLRGEFSAPHTAVTLHAELARDKGVVLMQGGVVEGRGVDVDEGRWLVMCLQKFYAMGEQPEEESAVAREGKERRKRLLEMFSRGDEGFKVEELVEEAERI
ncbi:ATP11 protein-domain-containing protein [Lineolata rhizophorae]|uniref:ATP11 protein-domain-containing protein n=1 Tax=Lineolata rhizophorae TaxID=578093 RepID=A0A6A6NMD3_9PEZI|nr:ATP11 protein-domain-containing protein [Lineolata rhizophorae]